MTAKVSTMKAWQYSSTHGGIENNLKLSSSAPLPKRKDSQSQHVVQILSTCINPVDYKAAEAIPSFLLKKPATPGLDFVGRIVEPASGSDLFKEQLVFGTTDGLVAGGALAEYAIAAKEGATALPDNLSPSDASTIGIAGLTAYQSIFPNDRKTSDRVFINGGSGGTGVFAIQIAKSLGCHVTTSCSTANVELCKTLGADVVIDYTKGSVVEALQDAKNKFDHVVDNVGSNHELYWRAHLYTTPSARFVCPASEPSLKFISFMLKVLLLPGFLGGGKRKFVGLVCQIKRDQLTQIGGWMAEGKVKAVFDQKFAFEDAREAIRKQKSGRAKGKIMVQVAALDMKA